MWVNVPITIGSDSQSKVATWRLKFLISCLNIGIYVIIVFQNSHFFSEAHDENRIFLNHLTRITRFLWSFDENWVCFRDPVIQIMLLRYIIFPLLKIGFLAKPLWKSPFLEIVWRNLLCLLLFKKMHTFPIIWRNSSCFSDLLIKLAFCFVILWGNSYFLPILWRTWRFFYRDWQSSHFRTILLQKHIFSRSC